MLRCYACEGDLMDMGGKLVCIRCFTINSLSGEEVDPKHTLKDTDTSSAYKESDEECF